MSLEYLWEMAGRLTWEQGPPAGPKWPSTQEQLVRSAEALREKELSGHASQLALPNCTKTRG